MVVGMDGGGLFVASHRSNVQLRVIVQTFDCASVWSGRVSKKGMGDSEAMVFVRRLDTQASFVRTRDGCEGRIVSKVGYRDNIQSIQTNLKWIVSMNNTRHHHTKFKTCPLPGPV